MDPELELALAGFPYGLSEYALTILLVEQGWASAGAIGRAKGIPARRAAASLLRCTKAGLLSRRPDEHGVFAYQLTNFGRARLDWLRACPPAGRSGSAYRFNSAGAKITFKEIIALVGDSVDSSPALVRELKLPQNLIAASLCRCWRMGFLSRTKIERHYKYTLTRKGRRLWNELVPQYPDDFTGGKPASSLSP